MMSVGLALLALLIGGCATPVAKIAQTPSGKPEVVINASPSQVKAALIDTLINAGYVLEKDTDYMLQFARPPKGMESFVISLVAGNAYTTNDIVASYTISPRSDGVRVVANVSARAVFPMGRVNSVPLDDNPHVFNSHQEELQKIEAKLERLIIEDTAQPAPATKTGP